MSTGSRTQHFYTSGRTSVSSAPLNDDDDVKSYLTIYLKIISRLVITDPTKFFTFCPSINHTRRHNRKLQKQSLPNSNLANTFSNRAIDCLELATKPSNNRNYSPFFHLQASQS